MAKYLLAYHGGGQHPTEEETAKVMAAWMAWFGQMGDAVVDGGNPVGQAKTIQPNGSVQDGGGTNAVTGYSVIEAPSIEKAVEMAKGCPNLAAGGSVEVAETFDVGP